MDDYWEENAGHVFFSKPLAAVFFSWFATSETDSEMRKNVT